MNPAETSAALGWMWRAFCVAGAAGHILSACTDDSDYAVLFHNANPVLCAAVASLRKAPSLPEGLVTEVEVDGGPEDRMDADTAKMIHHLALTLVGQIDICAPRAAEGASGADGAACREAENLQQTARRLQRTAALVPQRRAFRFQPGIIRDRCQAHGTAVTIEPKKRR
jgi:hypothetical protein